MTVSKKRKRMFKKISTKIKLRKKAKIIRKRFPSSNVSVDSFFSDKTELAGLNVICKRANITDSYIGLCSVVGPNSYLPKSIIGAFCSIADNVCVVEYRHPTSFVSSYPSFFNTINNYPFGKSDAAFEEVIKADDRHYILIGNDVWIGKNVLIKGGVTIGDGAVVGMGSVITKDVPPYSIVGGVPAKIIRYRFEKEVIDKLLEIKWWNWSLNKIDLNRNLFKNVDEFVKKFK